MNKKLKYSLSVVAAIIVLTFACLFYLNQKGLANTHNPYMYLKQKYYENRIVNDVYSNYEGIKFYSTVVIDSHNVKAKVGVPCGFGISYGDVGSGCLYSLENKSFKKIEDKWVEDK